MAKSLSQTPAPAKDRIKGSKVNPKGSASSEKSATKIKFDAKTIIALNNKLKEFREKHSNENITLNDLKAVYRRGLGAYSSSHRPTISGGKPNSRNAWAMARVNKFLLKAGGTKVKKAYVQDDDLMKYAKGGKLDVIKEEKRLGVLSINETHNYLKNKYKSFKKKNAELDDLPSIYIRAGLPKINKDGTFDVSMNYYLRKKEKGVSVFDAKYSPNSDFVFVDFRSGASGSETDIKMTYSSLQFDIEDNGDYERYESKMYLLEGERNGYGFDGEYLLNPKTLKVIGVLNPNKVVPPKSFLKEYLGFNRFYGGDRFDQYPKYADGGEIDKLIDDGVVELKMFETTNEHSKIYGFDAENPLYVQSLIVSKSNRMKGIGTKVMQYIFEYADKNGHDLIFGHITQKAEPNIDVIKSMLQKSGFNTIDGNNDFYKLINVTDMEYNDGGEAGQNIKCRRCGWEWNTSQSKEFDKYVCHNCGFDNRTFYDVDPIGYANGGNVKSFYDWYTDWYKRNKNEITIMISLPNELQPFKEDNVVIFEKFEKSNKSVKAYKYLQQIVDKADEYRVTIYLEPTPIGNTKTRNELIEYFQKFGFELTSNKEFMKRLPKYAKGGEVDEHKETYAKWKSLVNMSYGELKRFYDSKEGKEAGLSTSEANKQGISSGRESARMIMKMKTTPKDKWTDTMWKWANKQISFISRMSGMQGELYDEKGNKTRKHTSLLIWGHNPKKNTSMKYENGGGISNNFKIGDSVIVIGEDRYGASIKMINQNEATVKFKNGSEKKVLLKDLVLFKPTNIELRNKLQSEINEIERWLYENEGYETDSKVKAKQKKLIELEDKIEPIWLKNKAEEEKEVKKLKEKNEKVNKAKEIANKKFNSVWDSVKNKFSQVFFEEEDSTNPNEIYSNQVKAEEYKFMFDRYSKYGSSLSWQDAENKFLDMLTPEEKSIIKIEKNIKNVHEVFGVMWEKKILVKRTKYVDGGVMANGGFLIPQQGTLYTKDKKSKLEYYKKGNDYAFKVYDVENNPVQNYTRNQYKNRGKDEVLMTYNQFINYLYSELYIDDKFADGGEMDVRMQDTVQRMDNPNFADISYYKKGGELNPDDPKTKNEIVHKSGKVGGMLVGKRHSEGGIKAINKSTGQPLEMEGGEVVITRNAVSDEKKRLFEGEMLTNRQILSKINQSGGGVSFAKGGKVDNDGCGCNHYDAGGKITKDKRVISKMMKLYPQDFNKGVNEETREHGDTFKSLKQGKINLKETVKMVVAKHLHDKPNYYKNYNLGGYLSLGSLKIPSLKEFINLGYSIISPFENDDSIYVMVNDSENNDEKYYRDGDKKANKISNLLAYETYLYDNFGILFSQLPTKVKNGLTLGKQSLIDNYINS